MKTWDNIINQSNTPKAFVHAMSLLEIQVQAHDDFWHEMKAKKQDRINADYYALYEVK